MLNAECVLLTRRFMMRSRLLLSTIGAAALVWAGLSAQQEMLPRPGPGSGVTNVTGSVSISNTPVVRASQEGEWRVAIGNTAPVRVTELPSPSFLRPGTPYQVTWADGSTENVTMSAAPANGWIPVDGGRRWINLSAARSVADAR
jgi:hypothetical protein